MCGRFNQWRIRRTSNHVAARPTQLSRTGWPLSPKYVKLKACVQHTIIPVEEDPTGSSVTYCSLLFCVLCVSSGFSSACFLITSSNRQLFTNLISVVYSLIKKALLYTGKIVRRFVSFENFVALQVYKHIGKLLRNRQQFSIRFQVLVKMTVIFLVPNIRVKKQSLFFAHCPVLSSYPTESRKPSWWPA